MEEEQASLMAQYRPDELLGNDGDGDGDIEVVDTNSSGGCRARSEAWDPETDSRLRALVVDKEDSIAEIDPNELDFFLG